MMLSHRPLGMREVAGSNPARSTTKKKVTYLNDVVDDLSHLVQDEMSYVSWAEIQT